jgi:exodeoxyribonuclease VII small subunit
MERLEKIVSDMDNGSLDIDTLSEKLKEAQALVAECRDKLYKVDEEIKRLLDAESASIEK